MTDKQLSVRLHGTPIGTLMQTPLGKMNFVYEKNAKQAISIGMPLSDETYYEEQCEAFFGGLLPESETTKKLIGKQFGINPNNSFSLLKAIGYDCAGAISFHHLSDPINLQTALPLVGKTISDKELYQHIKELPRKPLFLGLDGLRLSLAGVQDKAAVCLIDGKIALPEQGCPTTHILKPSSTGLDGIVENEYFTLRVAKHIGLAVPEVEIRQIKDISFLLIERYDRSVQNHLVERIHQEDFCQALGIVSANKYQREGGPGFKECFALLENTTQPAVDRNKLLAGVVFNYLTGNMDAHSKNFSLLHRSSSQIGLTPFYDMICTLAYPDLTTKMAMKIGSKYQNEEIFPRHFEQLCQEIQYSYLGLKQLINKLANSILIAAAEEKQNLLEMNRDSQRVEKIIAVFNKQIERTMNRFQKA